MTPDLDDLADELDSILLRRDKLGLLIGRLRAVHRRLTRQRRYWPIIRPQDSALDEGPYIPPHEPNPWQGKPRRRQPRRGEDSHKTAWRKAKLPW